MNFLKHLVSATALLLISTLATAQVISPFKITTKIIQTKTGPILAETLAQMNEPWSMAYMPDGRLLITEKPGYLRLFSDGVLSEPVSGLPALTYNGQGGLLAVVVDPDYTQNHFVYFSYVEKAAVQPINPILIPDPRLGKFVDTTDITVKGLAVARARLEGERLSDVTVIWRQFPKTMGLGHYGGRLLFSPDGKLIITSGERQRFDPAQMMNTNLGKIIRINSDGSIPRDNPFVNRAGVRHEIWTLGHRNPLGAAYNPVSQQLWIHEMGPAHGDELNIVSKGKNYGWPIVSEGDNYDGTKIPDHDTRPKFAKPIYHWYPAVSPSGMAFYTGDLLKSWKGNLFLGALSAETLLRLTVDGNKITGEERIDVKKRVRDVIQANDGSLLLITDEKQGQLMRLSPAPVID